MKSDHCVQDNRSISVEMIEKRILNYLHTYSKGNSFNNEDVFVKSCGSSLIALDILCRLGDYFQISIPFCHIVSEIDITIHALSKKIQAILISHQSQKRL